MKTKKINIILLLAFIGIYGTIAQTAEDIIKKHTDAIGGKSIIDQIKTLYYESTIEAMGNESPSKVYIVDGKAFKMVTDIMGSQMITCVTDSFGWTVNPMMGINEPSPLPEDQYNNSKIQMYISDPLIDFEKKGNKIELLGQEMIASVNAYKIKITTASSSELTVYIDPSTYYIIRTEINMKMMGQDMKVIVTSSDFRKTDLGLVMAFVTESNFSDQFYLTTKIGKVELNKEIDTSIFKMGK